jgi:uncharacterized protein (TIGR03067 family)
MKLLLSVCLVLATGLIFADDDKEKEKDKDKEAVKKEMAKFNGTWNYESMEVNGEKMYLDQFKTAKMVLKDGTFSMSQGDITYKGTFKVDPTKKPKEIDITFKEGPEKGKSISGIYELTEDTYKICHAMGGKDRPKEFVSKKGGNTAMAVMKKQKDKKDEKKEEKKEEK